MENCDVPVHLQDNQRGRRVATRRQFPCCRDDQVQTLTRKRQRSAATGDPPQKRRRSSVARPADSPVSLCFLPKPRATILPADLPVASSVAHGLQPSSTPLHHEGPLIHNNSEQEYQQLYHQVVDDMLRFKNGRLKNNSIKLGRLIKQKLWERLDRPTSTEMVDKDGRVHVNVSYGVGVHPPHYFVDTSKEPEC